ncbi:MAG TPA: carbohydrate ABC transporter permease [Roseiflexaceae bacterium]|nr:carbohydrate ABC transporter permease [Roseiflexaceae bacterium]HMP40169.1 carbohydrate ABC transporter permease [Roseiflexaceae bacterium]
MAATEIRVAHPHTVTERILGVVFGILRLAAYVLLCFIFLIPFAWMFFGSLRAEREIFTYLTPFSLQTFIPIEWTLDSYLTILGLNDAGRMSGLGFGRNLMNSFFVSAAVVVSSLVFNTMGAYFFSRLKFPGKRWMLLIVLTTFLIPFEATIVPLYIVVRSLGIENSYWAMIIPWFASPFVIFSLMQFMRDQIPYELDEAALIDGAGYWTILWRIIVPNTVPGLVTNGLLEFQFIWNLFYWPLVAVSDSRIQVLQVAISGTLGQNQQYWGRTFAGSTLATLPVVVIFLLLQRFYIQGVASTGVKG